MNIVMYSLVVFIVVCIVFIWIVNTYNRFQALIIRINECEAGIDTVLRRRFDLLNKVIGIIEVNTEEENVLEIIGTLRSKKISNFELDRRIYDAINEYSVYREKYADLKKEVLSLERKQAELIEQNKKLITDISVLSSSDRIETIAEEELGMRKAESEEIVRVEMKEKK